MDHTRKLAVAVALLGALLTPAALRPQPAAADEDGAKAAVPDCLKVSQESRFRAYGYDHLVVIESNCQKPAHCEVSTDVNPKVTEVTVPARERVETLTARSSPAAKFVPKVRCSL